MLYGIMVRHIVGGDSKELTYTLGNSHIALRNFSWISQILFTIFISESSSRFYHIYILQVFPLVVLGYETYNSAGFSIA